jgi:hypothetical protein
MSRASGLGPSRPRLRGNRASCGRLLSRSGRSQTGRLLRRHGDRTVPLHLAAHRTIGITRPVRIGAGARVAAFVRWEQSGDGRRDCCSGTDGAVRQPGRRAAAARPERKPASASSGLSLPDFDAEATVTAVAGTPASATGSAGPWPTDNDPPAGRACASSNEPASRAGEPVDEKNVICPRAEDADPRIEVAVQELMLGRSVPRRGPENVGSFEHGPAVRRYAYRCPSQLTVLPQQRIVTPSAGDGQAAVEAPGQG